MKRVLPLLLAALPAWAEEVTVPSGQPVTFLDAIHNEPGADGLTLRFRFLAPEIARDGGTVSFDVAAKDMLALCNSYALPRVAQTGPMPAQIVISLSDVPVTFGQSSPEATQFFEAYQIKDGACIWDFF